MKKPKTNDEEIEYLENAMIAIGQNLLDASNELADMKPDDKNYQKQAVAVSILTKDFNVLVERYEAVVNPEVDYNSLPWWRRIDPTKILCAFGVCTFSMVQSLLIYKWQRDGYLMGRDTAKIQMPRPW